MRLTHPDGSTLHLAYCTNVHPAEDLHGIAHQLDTVAGRVRRHLGVARLGVGLWLPARAAAVLRREASQLTRLRDALERNGLEVVTLNGFPYGGFHDPVVKHAVYRPDWSDPARLHYTLDLAHVLARLLPDDVGRGTISTLPLGWAPWLDEQRLADCRAALAVLAEGLGALATASGRDIRVGLEPEPGCVLDTAAATIAWVAELDPWVGVSLDACHMAVEFEPPDAVAIALADADIDAVKLQVASALRVDQPDRDDRRAVVGRYAEPRFLHQTRAATDDGVVGVDDVDQADRRLPSDTEWRVHFHMPVHDDGPQTTQDVLRSALQALVGRSRPLVRTLEVETYTWTVLPPHRRPTSDDDLARVLASELAWTRDRLLDLGCEEAA